MKQKYLITLLACLTIGLAPFSPEPHIVGKLRWLFGGADGMSLMDYGDLLLHGSPWLVLIYLLISAIVAKKKD